MELLIYISHDDSYKTNTFVEMYKIASYYNINNYIYNQDDGSISADIIKYDSNIIIAKAIRYLLKTTHIPFNASIFINYICANLL